jgi:hypothetical protein
VNRVWLYQSIHAMASALAWRLVTNRWPRSRSTSNYPNSASLQALSQQLPRLIIDTVMPYTVKPYRMSWLAY